MKHEPFLVNNGKLIKFTYSNVLYVSLLNYTGRPQKYTLSETRQALLFWVADS